jgi:hypothetical protein
MAQTFATYDDLKTALMAHPDQILPAVELTPALADDILAHDPINRKLRPLNLAKLRREIEGGHWDGRKSTAMRFLPTGRLADGQHRCRAVVESKIAITVPMCIVTDTLGVDEGANRTLVDHLQLEGALNAEEAMLVSIVTKALCDVTAPSNRELLDYYHAHQAFILESVRKPLDWLSDQTAGVASIFKPIVLVVLRARAIHEAEQSPEAVDQFLYDAINGGKTAPENSSRRLLAKQLYDAMEEAFTAKKAKRRAMYEWLLAGLKLERDNVVKNIKTTRLGDKKKGRRKPPSRG